MLHSLGAMQPVPVLFILALLTPYGAIAPNISKQADFSALRLGHALLLSTIDQLPILAAACY